MQVILLERVAKLGQMGEVVKVKDGFARNYLLPQAKALRASEANIATFEARKAETEKKAKSCGACSGCSCASCSTLTSWY